MSRLCEQEDHLPSSDGQADQMFYSTVSNLDRNPSVSSDDDDDIYCPGLPSGGNVVSCPSNETEKTTDRQTDLDAQNRDRLKPYQVRQESSSGGRRVLQEGLT